MNTKQRGALVFAHRAGPDNPGLGKDIRIMT
jgi:hypothetical protein